MDWTGFGLDWRLFGVRLDLDWILIGFELENPWKIVSGGCKFEGAILIDPGDVNAQPLLFGTALLFCYRVGKFRILLSIKICFFRFHQSETSPQHSEISF